MKATRIWKVLVAVCTMLALAVGQTAKAMTGSGTQTDPFVISSVADWNTFATNVNAGTNADKYYKLNANIGSSSDPVTNMVGLRDDTNSILNPFSGHFDGNGKTIYVNVGGSVGAAPFRFIDGATIENLTVQGAVTCNLTDSNHAGGLVGLCGSDGSIVIKNCIVEANVSLTNYGGGIVGHAGHGNMTLQNCVFKGSINNFTTYAGGLVGWCDALTLTITNCFFVGSFTPGSGGLYHPIGCCNRSSDVTATITNAYYLNGITATASGNKPLPNATGTPISAISVANTWDTPITAPDGTTYYGAHVDGGSTNHELTVYEGTSTNYYTPMYVFYFDKFSRAQFVIPADSLTDMVGGTITSIKYYTTSRNIPYTIVSEFDIYMTEVTETSISAFVNKGSTDIVYHGTGEFISAGGGGEITITFDTPYTYGGGNLLIGCDNTTDAGYKDINFYGQTVSGASISGYDSSSLDAVSPTQRNFIPKTTFTYTSGSGVVIIPKPTGLTATLDINAPTTAILNWTENGTATQWQICLNNDETNLITTSSKPYTLTGLTPDTPYTAKVRAVTGDGNSGWSGSVTFTPSEKVVIGSGTSTSNYLPSYSYYKYSLTQQIYTAEEIGMAGNINSIDFYNAGTEKTRSYDIYLVHTDKESFSSGTDWITVSADDLVFSDNVTMVAGAWTTIDLDTPFAYDGSSNLALIVNDNTGSDSQGMSCRVFNATGMALYKYNDTTNYDPTNPNVTGTVTSTKNQIRLGITASGVTPPSRPTSLVASGITYNSATLTWEGGSGKYNVEYKATGDADWTRELSNTASTTCTLTGLTAETDYEARVQSVDATDNTLVGAWRTTTFTTLIRFEKPTDLTATLTPLDGTQATLSWTENGTATQWQLQYGTDAAFGDGTYTQTTASGTATKALTGLTPEAIYYARVRSVYEGEGESGWSTVISFNPTNKVVIGSGTSTSSLLPSGSSYSAKYALSQQIYTADEIGMAGSLTSIDFYNTGTEQTRNYDIYLVQTDKESFTSTSDWIAVSASDKVFSGNVTMVSGAWTTITFDTHFAYDGSNNILLVVDDNTGTAPTGMSCRVFTPTNENAAIYVYNTNDTNYDPTNPPSSGSRSSNKNQIRLGLTPYAVQPLSKPTGLTAALTPGNGTIATLNWTENGTATQWTLQYGTDEAFGAGSYVETTVSGTPSKALTGLTAETKYYARVKSIDGTDESVWSKIVAFTPTNDYALTVHDGTVTNQYVPIDGYNCDYYEKCEFVMPADELSAMAGGTINAMTFYLSQPAADSWGNANFRVFMKEVSSAAISAFSGTDDASVVYEGAIDGTQSTMTIEFTTPYTYGGGNLLIGIYNTVTGSFKKCVFYGETVNNASVQGSSSSSLDAVTANQRNFLPKTTFAYTPSGAPAMPTSFTAALTPGDGTIATLTWTENGTATQWTLQYGTDETFADGSYTEETVTGTPSLSLTGLIPETTYYARVRAVYADDESAWSSVCRFTPTDNYALTVYDGTATNEFVPINGYNCDYYLKCEFVMPANELTAMDGGDINAMTFYLSQPAPASWGDANFQVFMKEVSDATIDAFSGTEDATIVYEGAIDGTQSTMTINFTTPYAYEGGNLLIGIYNTVKGVWKRCYFYGETVNGASVQGHSSNSLDAVSLTLQNFLPKTTFNYIPASTCPRPTNVTISNISDESAVVSWTSSASAWTLRYKEAVATVWTTVNVTATTYTITGLDAGTGYEVQVQTNCGGGDYSNWTTVQTFFTSLCSLANQGTISYALTDNYGDGWNGAKIQVVHVNSGIVVAELTAEDHNVGNTQCTDNGTLNLCCGEVYDFFWVSGDFDEECSFVIYDAKGNVIVSHETDSQTAPIAGLLATYTMDCDTGLDLNHDGNVDVGDVETLANIVVGNISQAGYPISVLDVNNDSVVSVADITALVNYLKTLVP